jgi:hypothetical protein
LGVRFLFLAQPWTAIPRASVRDPRNAVESADLGRAALKHELGHFAVRVGGFGAWLIFE